MSIFKEFIKNKLRTLSSEELLYYGKQYGFSVSRKEAENIVSYLKQTPVDPFSKNDRRKMLTELSRITNLQTAKKAEKLFEEMIKSYGLEDLFY
ncbi:hypothetical protein CIL03_02085 [Virgibacillus indicus]|uniref:DUF2624 domain-containing protein n=1 Tax=Virgibacillus indicus TaxID=2024554 RepID=A0A265ND87_9BACI|nr:DUF2624 domain-containing protein [Virgibacillus indicus]OZU89953.1 hypothetical protein CIL03_02085 [Virgibacillus indicus]